MDQSFGLTWGLSFDDLTFINGYNKLAYLGVALQLKHLQHFSYFADEDTQVSHEILNYLGDQLGYNRAVRFDYDFQGRTARRHIMEIVQFLNFQRMSDEHRNQLGNWLRREHCSHTTVVEDLISTAYRWCLEKKVLHLLAKSLNELFGPHAVSFRKSSYWELLVSCLKMLLCKWKPHCPSQKHKQAFCA